MQTPLAVLLASLASTTSPLASTVIMNPQSGARPWFRTVTIGAPSSTRQNEPVASGTGIRSGSSGCPRFSHSWICSTSMPRCPVTFPCDPAPD
jgi:hypothetical protein